MTTGNFFKNQGDENEDATGFSSVQNENPKAGSTDVLTQLYTLVKKLAADTVKSQEDILTQKRDIENQKNILYLGFVIIIVMVGTLVWMSASEKVKADYLIMEKLGELEAARIPSATPNISIDNKMQTQPTSTANNSNL